ncbi:MAG TPA: hypothetical protein VFW65_28790 [Pseudonocardiaceae bacterium]|nr:hypothetical protein [Pseudonocardiaceae bacterium]
MAYGIILIPEVAVASRLLDFTREITDIAPTISSLGHSAVPHLTLIHVDSTRAAALRWWNDAVQRIGSSFPVTLTGLMFSPIPKENYYVPEGGIYVGLEAIRSASLDNAHRTLLSLTSESGCTPIGAVGDYFRPHISLCALAAFPHGQLSLPPDVTTTTIECRTAFGKLREYGTFGPDLVYHPGRAEPRTGTAH